MDEPSSRVEASSSSSWSTYSESSEPDYLDITSTYSDADLEWLRSKKLCEECQSIFQHWPAREDWEAQRPGHTHHNFACLKESAQNGCPICELFLDSFLERNLDGGEWPEPVTKGSVHVRVEYPMKHSYEVELTFGNRDLPEEPISALIIVEPDDHGHSGQIGAISEHTNSETTWRLAQMWLNSCIESHKSCTNLGFERILPSRLLYIKSLNTQPCLRFSKDLPEDTQYLSLIHCWGKKLFTTLTQSNLESFTHAIPKAALSKTFRDAVEATLKLRFHYIWIDSLCIVQDDPHDWKREAATMGHVDANSTLNLAAVDAPD